MNQLLALKAGAQCKAAKVLTVALLQNVLADSEAWF
jgi:hypothetical protein